MRATRYLLIFAGTVAVLAAVVWYLRDGLIKRYSNPRLQQYGLAITNISLNALAGDGATIGYLELEHESGTTIALADLRLPIGKRPGTTKVYSAGTVTVSLSSPGDGAPPDIAALLNRLLSLPQDLGGNELRVTELFVSPYPAVRDLRWTILHDAQSVQASVDSVPVALSITGTDTGRHDVVLTSPGTFQAGIARQNAGFLVQGSSVIDLLDFAPLAKLAGITPPEIDVRSGSAELDVTVSIPFDTNLSPSLTAGLSPTSPVSVRYAHESGETTSAMVTAGSPVEVVATFPEIDWSILQAESSLLVSYGEWMDVPVNISALSCQAGPACAMNAHVVFKAARLPVGRVAGASIRTGATVRFADDGPRLHISPGAALQVRGFGTADIEIGHIRARLDSPAELAITDAGWQISAGSIYGEIATAKIPGDVALDAKLRFDNVNVSELDGVPIARSRVSAPSLTATWAGYGIDLPATAGELERHAERASIDLKTTGLQQDGRIAVRHNLESGSGSLAVSPLILSLLKHKLSERVKPWKHDWDLAAGRLSANAEASWRLVDGGTVFDGRASVLIADAAGYYGDMAFTGVSTAIDVVRKAATGLRILPSDITVQLLDIGVPVEDIRADYAVDTEHMRVDVSRLSMSMLDGTVSADPFSFHSRSETNTLTLRAESIDLATLLTLKEFEAVEVTGRVAATLPMTIAADSITISAGTLTGEPPGGVIRYRPAKGIAQADVSGIGLAMRALSNFEYQTLTSDVDYSAAGDLNVRLRISGRNPDMDGGRPVVLNLGVENNVPQMLKSLRASRSVEDVLKKRVGK